MRNFGVVVSGLLYRSGKYQASELHQCVKRFGIKKVVDLRDRVQLFADSTYQNIGVEFRKYPLDENRPFPVDALSVFDGQTPTLVHCWKGVHRTGAWVAMYRILRQEWRTNEAIAEMMGYGFGEPSKHIELYESVRNAG